MTGLIFKNSCSYFYTSVFCYMYNVHIELFAGFDRKFPSCATQIAACAADEGRSCTKVPSACAGIQRRMKKTHCKKALTDFVFTCAETPKTN